MRVKEHVLQKHIRFTRVLKRYGEERQKMNIESIEFEIKYGACSDSQFGYCTIFHQMEKFHFQSESQSQVKKKLKRSQFGCNKIFGL